MFLKHGSGKVRHHATPRSDARPSPSISPSNEILPPPPSVLASKTVARSPRRTFTRSRRGLAAWWILSKSAVVCPEWLQRLRPVWLPYQTDNTRAGFPRSTWMNAYLTCCRACRRVLLNCGNVRGDGTVHLSLTMLTICHCQAELSWRFP